MTELEVINAMSVEELSEFLADHCYSCAVCVASHICNENDDRPCSAAISEWLMSQHKGGSNK